MKKIIFLFSTVSLVMYSCSNDSDKNDKNVVLPKTIKYTDIEFPSENSIATVIYNGNKIVSYTEDGERTDYTYDGDLIVRSMLRHRK